MSGALGIDEQTLADLPRYRESDRFTALEKSAIALAEAMTATPADVDPALRERLLAELGEAGLAELASAIAWENHRARLNRALGVESVGFTEGGFCLLPERAG